MRGRTLLVILSIALLVFQNSSAQDNSPSAEQILFYDDFEDSDLQGWDNSQQGAEVIQESDGNHALRLTGTDWAAIQVGEQTWSDYAVEARIKIIQPTDGGTPDVFYTVRDTGTGSDYNAYINANWGSVGGMGLNFDGQYIGLEASYVSQMPLIRMNSWHVFRFQVFGNQLKVYFDNQLISEYTDTENRISSGRVALVTAPNAEVYFDDVYVLNADIPAGLEPQPLVFEFDNTSATCDFTALPAPSEETLRGTTLRELNVRTEPDTNASVVTFLNAGDTFTFSNEVVIGSEVTMRLTLPLIWPYSSITNDTWLGVEVERNGTIQTGYIWGRAVAPNPPVNPFTNPYGDCLVQEDTAGWAEILRSEFGESWLSFGTPLQAMYATSVHVMLVLDGVWISQPIPLYDANNELLGIVHLAMRGYYLDARGDLQSIIIPIYVQIGANEAHQYITGPTVIDLNGIDFMPPRQFRGFYENIYPDLRGTIICTTVTEDLDQMLNYFGGTIGEDAEQIETYRAAHSTELARFIFAGDPGIGVLWSSGNNFSSCTPEEEGTPLNLP